jgi:hypothetical protein
MPELQTPTTSTEDLKPSISGSRDAPARTLAGTIGVHRSSIRCTSKRVRSLPIFVAGRITASPTATMVPGSTQKTLRTSTSALAMMAPTSSAAIAETNRLLDYGRGSARSVRPASPGYGMRDGSANRRASVHLRPGICARSIPAFLVAFAGEISPTPRNQRLKLARPP